MASGPVAQARSQETPIAPEPVAVVPAGRFAHFATMTVLALALSIVAILVAGCQDDGPPAGGGGFGLFGPPLISQAPGSVQTVAVELEDLYVEPERVEVPSGTRLQVEVTNNGDQEHDLKLNGETGTDRLRPGESQTADFGVIDADTQAWCTVPGHKEAGMLLAIVVTEPVPQTTTTTAPTSA